jgi:uncharacterized protein (TIGR02646 family)
VIKLDKLSEPTVLTENSTGWAARFEQDSSLRDYAHSDIRLRLREETHKKCAYCESRMEHVSPSNIEHIVPKSIRPDLVCTWSNLTLACEICNTSKGTYYNEDSPLINPYTDDPNEHLVWLGPMVSHITPDKGRLTKTRLKLNRPELLYQRAQQLERLKDIIDQLSNSPQSVKDALQQDIEALVDDDAEFAAASRAFASIYMAS